MYKTYDIGEGVLRLPLELCGPRQPCFLGCEYWYMTSGMYYGIREDNLYYDTSYTIIIARAADRRRGPFLPDFSILLHRGSTYGGRIRLWQPRILGVIQGFHYKWLDGYFVWCKKIYNSVIDGDDGSAGLLGPARVEIDSPRFRGA